MLGWELPPHNSGGLGVACYQLCQALSARDDVDLEFVLPYQAEHDIDFMKVTAVRPADVLEVTRAGSVYDSYKYTYVDGHEEWHDIYSQQAFYEKAVARLAFESEFDVVHAHDWLTFRGALRLKEMTGCPIVLHVHSIESDRAGGGYGNPLVREIEAEALSLADHIVAVSALTKYAIVREYGIDPSLISVVHNSLDHQSMEALEPSGNSYEYLVQLKSHGYKIITNIGRLTMQKGLTNLLRAAQEVVARAPKTIFLIVGNGDQYHELIELAASLGIGRNVLFADFQRGKKWRDAFGIADLFVMPSVSEPFGLTPLEATVYGTPSLITKQSGVSEVMHNCLKVDFWDVHEMANEILAVVQHDALRRELTIGAYRELQTMSWHHSATKISDIYHKYHVGVPA